MERTEYIFDEPCQQMIGRGTDCAIRVPTTLLSAGVSRHHCLLEIDPPAVRVRDLGSLNGTFVNGEAIRRPINSAPEDRGASASPAHELRGGDQLKIGGLVFQVGVLPSEEVLPAVYFPPAFE
jgi:pSer/pThr/pTyr-binding forkhead associated (FHA) protein